MFIVLLKQCGIRHRVISAGTMQCSIARSFEIKPDFTCHLIVDERGTWCFALSLDQKLGETVVISVPRCFKGLAA